LHFGRRGAKLRDHEWGAAVLRPAAFSIRKEAMPAEKTNGGTINGKISTRPMQRFGWIPDLPDARDYMYSAPEEVLAALPKKVDLRSKMPKVYDQGHLGSCTANAIGAAFEFDQVQAGGADFMPSRLFIYYNERAIEGTVDSDSGAMIRDGIKSVAKLGVCDDVMWPYDITRFTEQPPRQAYRDASKHQATVYRRVLGALHQMQGCLASGYPFVFGFSVYESFMSNQVAKTGEVPLPPRGEKLIGGHAVVAVGYDDSIQRFIVRNSWGTQWGRRGYCTMPYAYLTDPQLASDFWAIYTVEQAPNSPRRRTAARRKPAARRSRSTTAGDRVPMSHRRA
jgi:C1A family cysteine protease